MVAKRDGDVLFTKNKVIGIVIALIFLITITVIALVLKYNPKKDKQSRKCKKIEITPLDIKARSEPIKTIVKPEAADGEMPLPLHGPGIIDPKYQKKHQADRRGSLTYREEHIEKDIIVSSPPVIKLDRSHPDISDGSDSYSTFSDDLHRDQSIEETDFLLIKPDDIFKDHVPLKDFLANISKTVDETIVEIECLMRELKTILSSLKILPNGESVSQLGLEPILKELETLDWSWMYSIAKFDFHMVQQKFYTCYKSLDGIINYLESLVNNSLSVIEVPEDYYNYLEEYKNSPSHLKIAVSELLDMLQHAKMKVLTRLQEILHKRTVSIYYPEDLKIMTDRELSLLKSKYLYRSDSSDSAVEKASKDIRGEYIAFFLVINADRKEFKESIDKKQSRDVMMSNFEKYMDNLEAGMCFFVISYDDMVSKMKKAKKEVFESKAEPETKEEPIMESDLTTTDPKSVPSDTAVSDEEPETFEPFSFIRINPLPENTNEEVPWQDNNLDDALTSETESSDLDSPLSDSLEGVSPLSESPGNESTDISLDEFAPETPCSLKVQMPLGVNVTEVDLFRDIAMSVANCAIHVVSGTSVASTYKNRGAFLSKCKETLNYIRDTSSELKILGLRQKSGALTPEDCRKKVAKISKGFDDHINQPYVKFAHFLAYIRREPEVDAMLARNVTALNLLKEEAAINKDKTVEEKNNREDLIKRYTVLIESITRLKSGITNAKNTIPYAWDSIVKYYGPKGDVMTLAALSSKIGQLDFSLDNFVRRIQRLGELEMDLQ